MTCIAGTVEDPRVWFRFRGDDVVRMEGRHCTRTARDTLPRMCGSCPAFRGVDQRGLEVTGLAPDGAPYGLTEQEYAWWEHSLEELEPDYFYDRFDNGGLWSMRYSGTFLWDEHWAAYMREYRKREGFKDRTAAERMRRYRARRRAKREQG